MFQPSEHIVKLKTKQGPRDYLTCQWRLVWFREQFPNGQISTELVHLDLSAGVAVFKATVSTGEGGSATGHGCETAAEFGAAYLEKAETAALARALAGLGFGTQFAPELAEERIADAPVERNQPLTLARVKHACKQSGKAHDRGSWEIFVTATLGSYVAEPSDEQLQQLMAAAA